MLYNFDHGVSPSVSGTVIKKDVSCHLSETQGSYRLQILQDQADICFLPSVFQENQSVAFTTVKVESHGVWDFYPVFVCCA